MTQRHGNGNEIGIETVPYSQTISVVRPDNQWTTEMRSLRLTLFLVCLVIAFYW